MGAVPVAENVVGNFIAGLIKSIMTAGEDGAKAYLTALDPAVFGNPIIKFFVDEVLDELVKQLGQAFTNIATGVVIDIQTKGQNSAAVNAATALAFALAGKDPHAIAKAREDAIKAYGSLVHWDGIVTG